MVLAIKYLLKICIFWGLHVLYIFPIQKRFVYFTAFSGKHVCCNPKYIYEYMQKQCLPYRYVWCSENKDGITEKNVIFVRANSFKSIYYSLVAGIFITNNQVPDYIPFRKRQMIIETWHGGGIYKKDGYGDASHYRYSVTSFLGKRKRERLHYFISSSRLFTKYGLNDFCLEEKKFVPYGMPRNDIFFNKKKIKATYEKVRTLYGIDENKFIVMYAPTFRGDACSAVFDFSLDVERIADAVQKRFNKETVFLLRGHHSFGMSGISMDKENTVNVSDYPDMQELICAADMLITDYSSTLWDWSLTLKPAFLFVPDMDIYISDRGTYMPIADWGFPFAKTNVTLCEKITSFDEDLFSRNMHKHHKELGCYEDGHASGRIVHDIVEYIEGAS